MRSCSCVCQGMRLHSWSLLCKPLLRSWRLVRYHYHNYCHYCKYYVIHTTMHVHAAARQCQSKRTACCHCVMHTQVFASARAACTVGHACWQRAHSSASVCSSANIVHSCIGALPRYCYCNYCWWNCCYCCCITAGAECEALGSYRRGKSTCGTTQILIIEHSLDMCH
jgi:hypothetical protein